MPCGLPETGSCLYAHSAYCSRTFSMYFRFLLRTIHEEINYYEHKQLLLRLPPDCHIPELSQYMPVKKHICNNSPDDFGTYISHRLKWKQQKYRYPASLCNTEMCIRDRIKDVLLSALCCFSSLNLDCPFRMHSVKIRVGRDHLRFKPDTKLKADLVYFIYQMFQSACDLVCVNFPVAKRTVIAVRCV